MNIFQRFISIFAEILSKQNEISRKAHYSALYRTSVSMLMCSMFSFQPFPDVNKSIIVSFRTKVLMKSRLKSDVWVRRNLTALTDAASWIVVSSFCCCYCRLYDNWMLINVKIINKIIFYNIAIKVLRYLTFILCT